MNRGASEIDYKGNKKMIEDMGAKVVNNQADLQTYFNSLQEPADGNGVPDESILQMVFTDYCHC